MREGMQYHTNAVRQALHKNAKTPSFRHILSTLLPKHVNCKKTAQRPIPGFQSIQLSKTLSVDRNL